MKGLIIYLIRKRLGLKKNQRFQFKNQRNKNECYYFGPECLWKIVKADEGYTYCVSSNIRLNWLLSDECKAEIQWV